MSKSDKLSAAAKDRLQSFEAKQVLEKEKATRRTRDNKLALLVAAGSIVIAFAAQLTYFTLGPGSLPDPSESPAASEEPIDNSADVPSPEIAEARTWEGSMKVGDATLGITLDGENAPQAVANFISLAQDGFYEGVSCHRLTTAGIFVLQCGDPSGDGTGGPGYTWGPIENAPEGDTYTTGMLAMARRGGDAASMGSQFFIVYQDSQIPSDGAGGYTVFGTITSGLEDLAPVIEAGVEDGSTDGKPALPVSLGSIELK